MSTPYQVKNIEEWMGCLAKISSWNNQYLNTNFYKSMIDHCLSLQSNSTNKNDNQLNKIAFQLGFGFGHKRMVTRDDNSVYNQLIKVWRNYSSKKNVIMVNAMHGTESLKNAPNAKEKM